MTDRFEEILFDLFVPVGTDHHGIDAGSAIVAGVSQRGQQRVMVHFEGNRLGAENMRRYEERCLHAAGRAAVRYPTIAKASLPRSELRHVGIFDLQAQCVTDLLDVPALHAWLGNEVAPFSPAIRYSPPSRILSP